MVSDEPFTHEQLSEASRNAERRAVAVVESEMIQKAIEAVLHWNVYYADHDQHLLSDDLLAKLVIELTTITTGRPKA